MLKASFFNTNSIPESLLIRKQCLFLLKEETFDTKQLSKTFSIKPKAGIDMTKTIRHNYKMKRDQKVKYTISKHPTPHNPEKTNQLKQSQDDTKLRKTQTDQ